MHSVPSEEKEAFIFLASSCTPLEAVHQKRDENSPELLVRFPEVSPPAYLFVHILLTLISPLHIHLFLSNGWLPYCPLFLVVFCSTFLFTHGNKLLLDPLALFRVARFISGTLLFFPFSKLFCTVVQRVFLNPSLRTVMNNLVDEAKGLLSFERGTRVLLYVEMLTIGLANDQRVTIHPYL